MSATINSPAPDFALADLHGDIHHLAEARGRIAVVNFWSAECRWCEQADPEILAMREQWGPQVMLFTLAPNPNESRQQWLDAVARHGIPFILPDPGQRITAAYGAEITPHLFVVDAGGILRYAGAYNDVTFRKRQADINYLKEAVEALLRGELPAVQQTPPYGCAIVRGGESD
ncbi:MAG TPA: redoxin domain-containing protein [Anaerolineaceae bacterium]|nr:redoxin domain-containing protein [Anaerolineaceae bacterium]